MMYIADTHMHSTASFDGHASRLEMARSAAEHGISTICFTDHYDVADEWGQLVPAFDWDYARKEHQEALSAGLDLEILYGLELGNAYANYEAALASLEEPGLDVVIGSAHNSSEKLGFTDYYHVKFGSCEECYHYLDDYFRQVLELARWGHFDTLAHVPYPLRYMRDRDGCPVSMDRYRDQCNAILETIVKKGIALEVNTKGFRPARQDYAALLKRYRELGGELVTVGADAHRVHEVGRDIPEAYRLIREMGFEAVTVFRGRKPELHPLPTSF